VGTLLGRHLRENLDRGLKVGVIHTQNSVQLPEDLLNEAPGNGLIVLPLGTGGAFASHHRVPRDCGRFV